MKRSGLAKAALALLAGALLASCTSSQQEPTTGASPPPTAGGPEATNVVLITGDDLDWAVLENIPRLAALQSKGLTFDNFSVTDSLCCPSRVSIMRGQYVHNHQVISNVAATGGGWDVFKQRGEHEDCLPVWLHTAGVNTAHLGKYLNEFPDGEAEDYIPPGWDTWVTPVSKGAAYRGWNYKLNTNGQLTQAGEGEDEYLNDVLTGEAVRYLDERAQEPQTSFYMQFDSYLPHKPAPAAPRHEGSHEGAQLPTSPALNTPIVNPPAWTEGHEAAGPAEMASYQRNWVKRLESSEGFADSVEAILASLEANGQLDNTWIIITSDNGYHLGTHQLGKGKRTAYDTDTLVPAIVIGPGVQPGTRASELASTIDLAPTITNILGASSPDWVDGRDLMPVIDGRVGDGTVPWRGLIASESIGATTPEDVDWTEYTPPPFISVRTPRWLYVSYDDGTEELYDRISDPEQLINLAGTASRVVLNQLRQAATDMGTCAGETCHQVENTRIG